MNLNLRYIVSTPLITLAIFTGTILAQNQTSATVSGTTTTSTAINGFMVDAKGNLGVGTNAPRARLHVAGDSMTDGTIKGGGVNGRFGTAAVINGFDTTYGQRQFVLMYNNAATSSAAIQVYAIDPTDPSRSTFKTFIIDNPRDKSRYLVHASLEGPEGAVYYRGSAKLEHGRALIILPGYFESLTQKDQRTIQLTNIDGFDPLTVKTQNGVKIQNGSFLVVSKNAKSNQLFDWEVKAVRADGPPLQVEPLKTEIGVGGFGPYTYQTAGNERVEPQERKH